MPQVQLDGATIGDWRTFHDQCAAAFGFPAYYGRNMNAWIDCLTYIREGDGMSRFELGPEAPLVIEVLEAREFKRRAPDVFDALVECTAAVNQRHVAAGEVPALHLVLR